MPAKPEPQGVAWVEMEGGHPYYVQIGNRAIGQKYHYSDEAKYEANLINAALAPLLHAADRMAEYLEKDCHGEHVKSACEWCDVLAIYRQRRGK